ncbi:MAG: transglutaminase domain-containing protein [Clostridium sp.]
MGRFIRTFLIITSIIALSLYILPKAFKDKLEPIFLSSETKGTPTYNVSDYKDYYEAVRSSIKNLEPSINLVFRDNYLNEDRDKVLSYANDLIRTLGPGNYIRKYSITHKKSTVYEYYTITYNYEKELSEIKKQNLEVEKSVKKIISNIITPSMSDFEKEKVIHDYIVNNTRYDNENFEKNTTPIESHTAYGVFKNKTAVCEGYAIAMKKLLDEANVESLIVIGKADKYDHAWNLVRLEDNWYHVDPTWNDPVYKVNGKLVDIISYDYFNLSDKEILKDHSFEKRNYPESTGGKYSQKQK